MTDKENVKKAAIWISSTNWERMNRMKVRGQSFDEVIDMVFNKYEEDIKNVKKE